MHKIRERSLAFFCVLLILGVGDYVANRTAPVREVVTLVLLLLTFVVYWCFDRAGFVEQLFFFNSGQSISSEGHGAKLWGRSGHLPFVLTSFLIIAYIELTGRSGSPLFCLIYLIPLLAGLRYGTSVALVISCVVALRYYGDSIFESTTAITSRAVALSLPLSALCGGILRNALQPGFASITEHVSEMTTLSDVSQMLETAIDFDTTVNLLLINVRRIVDADNCAVYLLDPITRVLRLAAPLIDKDTTKFLPTINVKDLESNSWKLTSDEILQLHRSQEELKSWPDAESHHAIVSSLIGSEGVLGVLYLSRREQSGPFIQRDELALRRYSNHVSMSFQKAKYQESLSQLAFKDEMTDLANFRYFEKRLEEEILRAKRYELTVTVLLIDIDNFKKFNDESGHKAGDAVLRLFGNILKDCLRESDLPARYGGEEFIIICPRISNGEAKGLGERIRQRVENTEFDLGETLSGELTRAKITISIGSSTYPDHATNPGELVRQADRALYSAKQSGRNMVVTCDDLMADQSENERRPAA